MDGHYRLGNGLNVPTLLSIINDVQDQLGLPQSSAIISASDASTRQFYGLFRQLGRDLRKEVEWPQLNKQWQFSLKAVGPYTGDTAADSTTISNLSSVSGIEVGMCISSSGWNGIGSAANQVRVVSIGATSVVTNIPANAATTTGNIYFGADQYDLPTDFDEAVQRTHWDRYNRWELVGPLTPQEWQWYESGIISQTPRRRFRVKGLEDKKFNINVPPSTSENGQYLAFEYQTANWIRPPTWTTNTSFAAGSYCFYNGNFYYTSSGGTTGSNPPLQITGSMSDGGVTWDYYDGIYAENITSDSSVPLINYDMFVLGLKYYWRKEKRLYHDDLKAEFDAKVAIYTKALRGSRIVNMRPNSYPSWLIGYPNIPDTGYGASNT